MRLFKACYRDRDGKARKSAKWYVEFRDHQAIRRRVPAFKNKTASSEFGHKLESLVACRIAGERPQGDLGKWLESLSAKIIAKLVSLGILEARRTAAGKPLSEHLTDYCAALRAKGNGEEHVKATEARVNRILDGCGFRFWSGISASRAQGFLADLRSDEDMSIRTSNAHLVAFKAFCNWYVRDGRASESPVQHLQRLNARTDVRRKRRALSADELRKVIQAAREGEAWRGMLGPERAMLYRMAAETGLRWSELRSLRRASFDLHGKPPTVTVNAGYSKHKREDCLPLRQETARALHRFFADAPALSNVAAFPNMPKGRVGAKMIKADLEAAGIPVKDGTEAVADFHALRHWFCSALAQGGVHPKTAQDLARHSDINLTMGVYTHTVLERRSNALEALPDLGQAPSAQRMRATGTGGDTVLVHCLPKQSKSDPIQADQNRQSEGRNVGKVEAEESLAHTGKSLHLQGSQDWSGRADLNRRPLDPQSSALSMLRHAPSRPSCTALL